MQPAKFVWITMRWTKLNLIFEFFKHVRVLILNSINSPYCTAILLHIFYKCIFMSPRSALSLSWDGPYHIETSPLICPAKSMDWFLYDRHLHHERVNYNVILSLVSDLDSYDISSKLDTFSILQGAIAAIFLKKNFLARLFEPFSWVVKDVSIYSSSENFETFSRFLLNLSIVI